MNVAIAADDNFAQHLCVTALSLVSNLSANVFVNLYVLDGGISFQKRSKIDASFRHMTDRVCIRYLCLDVGNFSGFKQTSNISRAAYLRIQLPTLCKDIDRILYLDSDMVILGDMSQVYFGDFEGSWIQAVQDPNLLMDRIYRTVLDIPGDRGFFNSGMMIVDLVAFRSNGVEQKVMNELKRINLIPGNPNLDQSALNGVLWHKWKRLSPKWNWIATLSAYRGNRYTTYGSSEFNECSANPQVIHYASPHWKPWKPTSIGKYRCEYFRYLAQTSFSLERRTSLRHVVIRSVLSIYYYLVPVFIYFYLRAAHYYGALAIRRYA